MFTDVREHTLQSVSRVGVNVGVWGNGQKAQSTECADGRDGQKPGRHADGGGLYLVVDKSGAKRWVFLFRFGGPLKEMGLGGLTRVSLVEARRLAEWCRSTLAKGENPIEARKAAGRVPTFGECADEFVASMAANGATREHRRQWAMTLTRYTETIRSMPVNMIETAEVLRVLQPVWQKIPETAARLRGRIERVLDAAQARGFRSGENPARWRGHLDTLLPPRRSSPEAIMRRCPITSCRRSWPGCGHATG